MFCRMENIEIKFTGVIIGKHGRPLKGSIVKGYNMVSVDKKMVFVHKLVASKYLHKAKDSFVINHIDNNKKNNHVSNLEWCTQKYNRRCHSKYIDVIKPVRDALNNGERVVDIVKRLGVNRDLVNNIKNKGTWA